MAERSTRPRGTTTLVFAGVGGTAIAIGAVGFTTIGYWYATDMGWTGYSASTLVVSRTPIAFGLLVAFCCVVAGASMILVRHAVPATSPGGMVLLVTVITLSIAVLVGIRAYPQVEQAELLAHGDARWRTRLPVTEVFGMLSETDDTITVEGRADRRGCNWVSRSVTIERDTGRIVEVAQLPNVLLPGEEPRGRVPIPVDFEVIQGSAPFICRN